MAMAERWVTSILMDDADLLTLMQWLSPAFPVGGFAWSHGLETVVAAGEVKTAQDMEAWLRAVILRGSGRSDAVLLTQAMDPRADIGALAEFAEALASSKERWAETQSQGAAFARTVSTLTGDPVPDVALPVAVGVAARRLKLPKHRVAGLYLQAFAGNLVSVATRFVPLGQTEGQRVLANLNGAFLATAKEAVELSLDDISTSVPGADLAAMAHETLDVRIFRS